MKKLNSGKIFKTRSNNIEMNKDPKDISEEELTAISNVAQDLDIALTKNKQKLNQIMPPKESVNILKELIGIPDRKAFEGKFIEYICLGLSALFNLSLFVFAMSSSLYSDKLSLTTKIDGVEKNYAVIEKQQSINTEDIIKLEAKDHSLESSIHQLDKDYHQVRIDLNKTREDQSNLIGYIKDDMNNIKSYMRSNNNASK